MKTISSRFPHSKRGMALISVLAVLLLLTLLVVAFMSRTTAARSASASYHATASTRLLADTAVNLVQAQINEATTVGMGVNADGTVNGKNPVDTWGSQPGAIRVFQNNVNTPMLGSLAYIYRLYSAAPPNPAANNTPRMINVSASADPAATTTALSELAADLPADSNWTQYSAQWCDLNSFVTDSAGKYHFPIVDPRDPNADPTVNPTTGGIGTLWKPAGSNPALHGFSIQPPASVGVAANPAPMPVRWLYMLKDGSLVAPDSTGNDSNVLTFKNAVNVSGNSDTPSVQNPIIGRIAYWTDDDTSKININTAAGDDVVRNPNQFAADSIFWATPAFCMPDEVSLARFQPVNGEIQRYSGHPGTVGLNTVLSTLMGLSTPMDYSDFYSLTPRYTAGGSQSATVSVPYTGVNAPYLPLTATRLYTSVGEMLFKVPASTDTSRTPSVLVSDSASEANAAAAVERANFFLTAHSASSELNLWGEPRISIWPITIAHQAWTDSQSKTPTDSLISFDSTIARTVGAPNYFYFERSDATSSITDCNNIPNNILLFKYLDTLTSTAIPGFGKSFLDKYNGGTAATSTHQIISEIFDYVRTINMLDPLLVQNTPAGQPSMAYGQNWGLPTAGVISNGNRSGCGGYQVVPSANGGSGVNGWKTQGLGAFPIPVELTVHFVAMGLGYQPPLKNAQGVVTRPGVAEIPVAWQQYNDPNVASDQGTTSLALPTSATNYLFTTKDAIIPEDMAWPRPPGPPTPGTIEAQTASTEFDQLALPSNPAQPVAAPYIYTNPPSGRPSDWSTAMQAFVYVSFVNPGQTTARNQPMFCYSLTGLNSFGVKDPTLTTPSVIPLLFPGSVNNNSSTPPYKNPGGSLTDEEFVVVDNSTGAGFINGWVGDWIFGYIPWDGAVGINNYQFWGVDNASLCPNATLARGPGNYINNQKLWSLAEVVDVSKTPVPGGNSNWPQDPSKGYNANTITGRGFAHYSQLFCLSGEQQQQTTIGTPNPYPASAGSPNGTGTFVFTGGTVTISMYDANHDNQGLVPLDATVHKVNSYSVVFPQATLPLPTYGSSDLHLVGTAQDLTERWHQGSNNANGATIYDDMITPNDVAISMTLSPSWSDARDLAIYSNNGATTTFAKHPNYGLSTTAQGAGMAHNLLVDSAAPFIGNNNPTNWGRLVTQTVGGTTSYNPSTDTNPYTQSVQFNYPIVPPRLNGSAGLGLTGQGAYTTTGVPGDWDNGTAFYPDGPWDNFPDEGALATNAQQGGEMNSVAYFNTGNLAQKSGIVSTFSANREMPSPVMFGSLPTGILSTSNSTITHPWQTLLFRPGPHAGGFPSKFHPGERNQPNNGDPEDELLLDLFWMPQAEPYPISQPFVTEGKINLNYEIQPFTYITRDTALRALLEGEKIAVLPDAMASSYKVAANPQTGSVQVTGLVQGMQTATGNKDVAGNTRLPIDVDQTLGLNPDTTADPHNPSSGTSTTTTAQTYGSLSVNGVNNAWYDSVLKTTRFFRSGAELCDMFLVPQGYDWYEFSGVSLGTHSWYKIPGGDFALVGDNTRERPYADLYSRVTTKSNTYTVYYTVQSLQNAEPRINATGTTPGQQIWDESKGGVTGEYRGSTIVERYIDPNEVLPDFLDNPTVLQSLEPYYKWRVIEQRQFAP